MRRLNGWQRLWAVLTVLWTPVVLVTSYALWPARYVSMDPNAGAGTPAQRRILFERLAQRSGLRPTDGRQYVDRALTDRELYVVSMERAADTMFTPEERQRLHWLTEEDSEKTERANRRRSVTAAVTAFGFWAVPPIGLYVLGWAAGWVRLGFQDKVAERVDSQVGDVASGRTRMTLHPTRIVVVVAVLSGIGACGRSERSGAQQTLDEASPENPFRLQPVSENPFRRGTELRALAEQGDADAQVNLGVMHLAGTGVSQDYAEAIRWFRLAADQGLASAQHNLGIMYDNGEGVPEDNAEAVRWYRLAADQGLARAQHNLGIMHRRGEGIVQDYVQAHMWHNLAAAQLSGEDREQYVKGRDAVAEEMTADQIAEAQRRAREWTPTPEP